MDQSVFRANWSLQKNEEKKTDQIPCASSHSSILSVIVADPQCIDCTTDVKDKEDGTTKQFRQHLNHAAAAATRALFINVRLWCYMFTAPTNHTRRIAWIFNNIFVHYIIFMCVRLLGVERP